MGQKTIPTSLRLNQNQNWKCQWMVDKYEYSNFLYFHLEIQKYFEKILNQNQNQKRKKKKKQDQIQIINFNVIKISKNINIYILLKTENHLRYFKYFHHQFLNHLKFLNPNHSIKIFIKKLENKEFKILKKSVGKIFRYVKKKYKINYHVKQMIYTFSYALYTKNIDMIMIYIKNALERKKIHKNIIKNINNILECFFNLFSNWIGYRLQLKGRLNGSKRKRKFIYQKGKIPLNTLKYDIQYQSDEFQTPSGLCSIKLWIFFKK
jgi:hypothetical protein